MRSLLLTSILLFGCEADNPETDPKEVHSDTACVATDEACNGIDDNCDGVVDEGLTEPWYADVDADGFGDPASGIAACEAPEDFVSNDADCDDTNADIHPGAQEACNGVDDDCNAQIDEGVGRLWFPDLDGDGFGYDVRSFDPQNERERFIEVKTTRSGILTPFYLTRNEVEVSKRVCDQFSLYRVHSYGLRTRVYWLDGPLEATCDLAAMSFRALPKARSA